MAYSDNARRERIYEAVDEERERQDRKFHERSGFWPVSDERRLAVLMEEVGEVANTILEGHSADMATELVQVAAVCFKWLEALSTQETGDA